MGARAFAAATAPQPGLLSKLALQRTDLSSLSTQELATGGEQSEPTTQAERASRGQERTPTRRGGSNAPVSNATPSTDQPTSQGAASPGSPASAAGESNQERDPKPSTNDQPPGGSRSEPAAASPASTHSALPASPAARAVPLVAATTRGEGARSPGVQGVSPGTSRRADARVLAQKSAHSPAQPVIRQAVQGLAAALTRKDGQVTLRLAPEQLGELKIQLKLRGTTVEAKIEASTEPAKKLLERERDSLRAALESRGLNVERVEISLRPESEPSWMGADSPRQEHGSTSDQSSNHTQDHTQDHPHRSDLTAAEQHIVTLAEQDRGVWTDLQGGGVLRVDAIA